MPDGGGLYFQVSKQGYASWVYRYTVDGKQHWMGLGPYPDVNATEARELASKARGLRRKGIDPLLHKKQKRRQGRAVMGVQRTFKQLANEYTKAREEAWSAKHARQWQATLEDYAYPKIGELYPDQVTLDHVVSILKPHWYSKGETARRVRGRIERVLDYAKAHELLTGENPAVLGPRLKELLSDDAVNKKPVHLAALPYTDIQAFILDLRAKDEIARLALEWTIFTASRTGEVMQARWTEIDRAAAVWNIPGERMKHGFTHRIPLSSGALSVLDRLPIVDGSDWLFPGHKRNTHISNNAMLALLRKRMEDWPGVTVHGFRSTFRDWVADQTSYANTVAEKALAHSIGDKTEAAYRRGDMLERRRPLMEDWARFVNRQPMGGQVVKIGG